MLLNALDQMTVIVLHVTSGRTFTVFILMSWALPIALTTVYCATAEIPEPPTARTLMTERLKRYAVPAVIPNVAYWTIIFRVPVIALTATLELQPTPVSMMIVMGYATREYPIIPVPDQTTALQHPTARSWAPAQAVL
jgi:hypothetical protein